MTTPLIEIQNLSKSFKAGKKILSAFRNINLAIYSRETVALVGESGCGKSTLAKTMLRLYEASSGSVYYKEQDICQLPLKNMLPIRRDLQIIFQNPYSSLNPRMTIQEILEEPLMIHHLAKGELRKSRLEKLLDMVGLNAQYLYRYPHELSGGQCQRVSIARALAVEPQFIVCDEPLSALDNSTQSRIIDLLNNLQQTLGLTLLFISHDLSMMQHFSDRIAVMYLGQLIELAPTSQLFQNPLHPYTQALLSAIPIPDPILERKRSRIVLKGEIPNPFQTVKGCVFACRCPFVMPICQSTPPTWQEVNPGHFTACHLISKNT